MDYQLKRSDQELNNLIKIFLASLVLLLVSTSVLVQGSSENTINSNASDKALSFITNVIQLDMTKYSATIKGHSVDYPDKLFGIAQEGLTYVLESEESKLDVFCRFTNGTLTYCLVTADMGLPLYAKQSDNLLDEASNLLDRYQSWTNDSSLKLMNETLQNVNIHEDITTTSDNMMLEVFWYGDFPSFYWKSKFNNVTYSTMGFAFNEEKFAFGDDRNIYAIGSTNTDVSKEDAIEIALKHIESYSYTVEMGSEPSIEVTNFEIAEEKITANLLTWQREPLKLYPYWNIKLKLASTHPGFVTAINIGIWADTAEILFCDPVGWGASIPVENQITDLSTQVQTSETQPLTAYTIAVLATIIIVIISAIVIRKKKHK